MSTYSCSTSVAGDDQSSISSSSSSQSDVSSGGRLAFWVEPSARLHLSNEAASSCSAMKALSGSHHLLRATAGGASGPRPSSSQSQARRLNDSGRQSSLDSGIGIAAGSQSSYSGSFSSYTGSLDSSSQGGSEEFGSIASLPASPPPSAPPPSPPPSLQCTFNPENRSCATTPCPWNFNFSLSQRHSGEHQTPSLLRLLGYDSPRRVLQSPSVREASKKHGKHGGSQGGGESWGQRLSSRRQRTSSWGSDMAPSVDGEENCTPNLLTQAGDLASEVGKN